MDALHNKPVDRVAVRILSRGEQYRSPKKITQAHQALPFPLGKMPRKPDSGFVNLTGNRRGRLTVIGILKDSLSKWICRCDCGNHVLRKAKSIKNEKNQQDRCEDCRHLAYLKRKEHYRRTGNDVDITNF